MGSKVGVTMQGMGQRAKSVLKRRFHREKDVVEGGFTNQMNMTQSSCDGVIGTKEQQFPRNL